jgi:hypothetical protein
MTDVGPVQWLLGIEISRDNDGAFLLRQRKYVETMLERFGMADCRPVATPMDVSVHLSADMSPQTDEEQEAMASVPYRSAVGSLMYLMVSTRPDIAAAVGVVSRFAERPGPQHWVAVKRIFRYLRGSTAMALRLSGSVPVRLAGWCDADWAGDVDTRRSTTGYAFSVGQGCISWASKRQVTVALSSTEAEYMSASMAAREAVWLRQLLVDVGFELPGPTVLHADNQGAIALVRNPVHHQRSKHIDVQAHFIRQLHEEQHISVVYCPTEHQVADVLTKALPLEKHRMCCAGLGLVE